METFQLTLSHCGVGCVDCNSTLKVDLAATQWNTCLSTPSGLAYMIPCVITGGGEVASRTPAGTSDPISGAAFSSVGITLLVILFSVMVPCSWCMVAQASNYLQRIADIEAAKKQSFTEEDIERYFPHVAMPGNTEIVCVICLSTIQEGQSRRELQCHHQFHSECISDWWTYGPRQSLFCPTCHREQDLSSNEGPTPATIGRDHPEMPDIEAPETTELEAEKEGAIVVV